MYQFVLFGVVYTDDSWHKIDLHQNIISNLNTTIFDTKRLHTMNVYQMLSLNIKMHKQTRKLLILMFNYLIICTCEAMEYMFCIFSWKRELLIEREF